MNIYNCWHAGVYGYACRSKGKSWLFVPEAGQINDRIQDNLGLDDLIFQNKVDKSKERAIEEMVNNHNDQVETPVQNQFNLERFAELLGISD